METTKDRRIIEDGLQDEKPILNLDELRKNPSTISIHLDGIIDSLSRSYLNGDFSNKPVIKGEIFSAEELERYHRAQSDGVFHKPTEYSINWGLMEKIDTKAKNTQKKIESFDSNRNIIALTSGVVGGVGAVMGSYQPIENFYQLFENQTPVLEYLPNVLALGTTLGLCAVAGYVAKEVGSSLYKTARASSRDKALAQYNALHTTAHEIAGNIVDQKQQATLHPATFSRFEEFGNNDLLWRNRIYNTWWRES